MTDPVPERPAICLNMIVRNEAHIIREGLDSVAPYISSWVIVDTGSTDGTQDVIRNHLEFLGIPGQLYQRPWRNFGHNRTEALSLAQSRGDYIWVMDADDIVVGTPDFAGLTADVYYLRLRQSGSFVYWRAQLFRNGVPWLYRGVVHEYAYCHAPHTVADLAGDYHIESRRVGARNLEPQKYARDRDLLLEELEHNPDDSRSVFYLANSYRDLADFGNAAKWYARRAEMGGWDQEVFAAMYELAKAKAHAGEPWPDVEEAYLRAWEFRPTRAEPLYEIARHYREGQRYRLGYLFAGPAAAIPFPDDALFVQGDVYSWRATDERAVCASQIGEHTEAFALFRRLLAQPDIPDGERRRIAKNRDFSVPTMLDAAASYPDEVVRGLITGAPDPEVSVSLIAGPDRAEAERTLNSFLNCCTDVSRVGRFLLVDAGLSAPDRALLADRYGFVEFVEPDPGADPGMLPAQIRDRGRFWLQLGRGWRFFAPEDYITRLTAVLAAEPQVFQVGINLDDAVGLTGACAAEQEVRRTPDAGRYLLTETAPTGPAMFDTTRLDRAGLRAATLDEVLCIAAD